MLLAQLSEACVLDSCQPVDKPLQAMCQREQDSRLAMPNEFDHRLLPPVKEQKSSTVSPSATARQSNMTCSP